MRLDTTIVQRMDQRMILAPRMIQSMEILQLLLNPFLQGHDRQLQDFHRLNHAGGQDHPLVHPLGHGRVKSHRR